MGNRAHVIFEDEKSTEFSPAIYLHWNGGPESVYAFLDELDYRKVRGDQVYEAARFVQIVGEFFDQDKLTSLSLGITNGPERLNVRQMEPYDHGDNGIYVVCRCMNGGNKRRVRRFTVEHDKNDKPELREANEVDVARERKAAYKTEGYHVDTGKGVMADAWRTIHGDKAVE